MTQSVNSLDRKKAIEKWTPIIESMGVTGEKSDWLSQYANIHSQNDIFPDTLFPGLTSSSIQAIQTLSEDFPSLLPMSMKIAAQTIATDLVAVKPIGGGNSSEEIRKIDAEIKAQNREGKIDAVIEDKEYVEKTREDHPLYEKGKGPLGVLMYMDFKYESSNPTQSSSMPISKNSKKRK